MSQSQRQKERGTDRHMWTERRGQRDLRKSVPVSDICELGRAGLSVGKNVVGREERKYVWLWWGGHMGRTMSCFHLPPEGSYTLKRRGRKEEGIAGG